jgi:hypothetical protein
MNINTVKQGWNAYRLDEAFSQTQFYHKASIVLPCRLRWWLVSAQELSVQGIGEFDASFIKPVYSFFFLLRIFGTCPHYEGVSNTGI